MSWRILLRLRLLVPLLLLAVAAGCGSGRYPVSGRVTYEDGSPVEAGIVIGEATVNDELVGVQGNIERDGSFRWGADTPGDGALPGEYRVIVVPVSLGDSELAEGKLPAVHSKFTRYETSGITFEVKPEENVLNIRVARPNPRRS
jgi:hypothetical protein